MKVFSMKAEKKGPASICTYLKDYHGKACLPLDGRSRPNEYTLSGNMVVNTRRIVFKTWKSLLFVYECCRGE